MFGTRVLRLEFDDDVPTQLQVVEVRSGAYGDEVALPAPLSFPLTTRRLPRYASGGPPAAR
ncbi:hypothetical protein GCM10010271_23160 [Streptomyces kurssanovii]|nr:hypothetical protein GCM10010271_23160 [Streptomyces kurssanovii]